MEAVPLPRLQKDSIAAAVLTGLAGLFLLDFMGVFIRVLGSDYSVFQLSALRNLFGLVPPLLALVWAEDWRRRGRPWRLPRWPLALLRGLLAIGAQFCFYTALLHMAFATAGTLDFASPLFVTALSIPLLGDRVGGPRWLAVAIGFIGILLVMRPGSEVFTWYTLLPIGAAAGYATMSVMVRLFPAPAPVPLINLYSQCVALAGATVLMLVTGAYRPIAGLLDWSLIVTMGLVGGAGVLLLATAYRMTQPSNMAPFEYFGIAFAFVLGWVFFNEAPFDRLFPGALLIVAGGLIVVWRERRRAAT